MSQQSGFIVVAPHPDDEGQAFGFLEMASQALAIVSLTLGEATKRRLSGSFARNVAGDRMDRWHWFIDTVFGCDRGIQRTVPSGSVWHGYNGIRYALDGGDGKLTVERVLFLLDVVLSDLSAACPVDLVLCAYEGSDYRHSDHAAVAASAAVLARDRRVGRVYLRSSSGIFVNGATDSYYERMMGRDGVFQDAFGWLAPDGKSWMSSRDAGLFPQVSRFRVWPSA